MKVLTLVSGLLSPAWLLAADPALGPVPGTAPPSAITTQPARPATNRPADAPTTSSTALPSRQGPVSSDVSRPVTPVATPPVARYAASPWPFRSNRCLLPCPVPAKPSWCW